METNIVENEKLTEEEKKKLHDDFQEHIKNGHCGEPECTWCED